MLAGIKDQVLQNGRIYTSCNQESARNPILDIRRSASVLAHCQGWRARAELNRGELRVSPPAALQSVCRRPGGGEELQNRPDQGREDIPTHLWRDDRREGVQQTGVQEAAAREGAAERVFPATVQRVREDHELPAPAAGDRGSGAEISCAEPGFGDKWFE